MTLDFSPLLEIEVRTGGVTIGHAPTVAEPGPLRFVLASFNLFQFPAAAKVSPSQW